MKRLLTALIVLVWVTGASADFLGIKQTSEEVAFFLKEALDSVGVEGKPDSAHVMTYKDNASAATFQARSTTYPFSDISIDTLKIYGDTVYVFKDEIADLDGTASNSVLAIKVTLFTNTLPTTTTATVQVITDSLNVLASINDSLEAQDGWVAKEASLAYFDTLIYVGPRGLGVYLDSAASNTNTVIGTDGTSKNPVSTIAAAKTIATALGYNRYYFLNASTFNDAANDIPSSHQNWEFIGIGHSNELAFGTQRVDASLFKNLTLSGVMHASGGSVLYEKCNLNYISANFNGHADNCWIMDTVVVKAGREIEFTNCQSGVPGNETPTIDFSGGSSSMSIRDYSGGIRIMNASSLDTISIETDGQVIVSANNTSLNITLRGMMSVTDSGTTTNMTEDAVFNRTDVPPLIADSTWLADFETHDGVAGSFGDSAQLWSGASAATWTSAQRDSVLRNMEDRALSLAKFDTAAVAAYYDFGIWLDDGAANTNTTVGVDGTRANPVSTVAAARILADSMGLMKYYITNNSSFTLGATHEDWCFTGIGESNGVNFGGQDVDNSHFEHVMVAGVQGGTGLIWLNECYLNAADSLECVARNSWFSDTISVRVASNIVFDNCYSAVAGNNTPGLDFNSGGGTINVNVRHYSGGLALFNMTSNHTISYETDGQLVIDASCTGAKITTRGNMTITDNGTSTALTADAVYNKGYVADTVWTRGTRTITGADAGAIQLGDADIRYAGYLVIGTVEDSAGNTAALFQTDLSAANNDYYNFATLVFIEGNNGGLARPIGDYTGASGVIKLTPALVTVPAAGDSFAIVTSIAGIMPFEPESTQIKLFSGWVGPDFDNANGGLDSIQFGDSYYHAIAVASDSGAASNNAAISRIERVVGPHVGTVNDAAPTASQFVVSAGIGAYGDDFFNDLYLTFITGNLLGRTKRVTDFETTNDTIFINTFFAAPANGDSFSVGPGNFDLAMDSLFYQGAAAGLTAAGIWQYEIRADTTDGAVDDTSAADHLYSASVGGGGASAADVWNYDISDFIDTTSNIRAGQYLSGVGLNLVGQSIATLHMKIGDYSGAAGDDNNVQDDIDATPAAVWNYEGISDFEDSTGNDQAGQYLFSVGLHNVGQNAPTVHMKLGTAYDGTGGNNVSDDFDTTFAKLDAMGSGTGQFACSLLAYDGSNYISPARVRMVSGAQEFRVDVSADGWAVFALDGGTWTALVTALRYVQDTIPQTFTFSADYKDTLTMTTFSPSTPTDTGKVVLYVWTDRILGDTLEGATLRVIPVDKGKNWVTGGNRILALGETTKKTDSTGYAEIEVYQSSYTHPYPSGSDSLKYNISVTYPGLSSWAQFRFVAPDSGNQYQIGVLE